MERNLNLRMLIVQSNFTKDQVEKFTARTLTYYEQYARGLPEESAWKHGKAEHVMHGSVIIHENAKLFGLEGLEIDIVAFPLVAHDTGRLIHEHVQRGASCMLPWQHGVESALLAEHAMGELAKTWLGKALLLAIKHHSDLKTPSIADLNNSYAAHALTGLVRDLDKMSGFDDAEKYVNDAEFKSKQILTNFSVQRKNDPTWGNEKGRIVPDAMLDIFLSGRALIRRECQSYEAYMAQYLAWVFDIQNHEVLELCVDSGGPQSVLYYLLRQLKAGAPEQYQQLKAWAETWHEGILVKS